MALTPEEQKELLDSITVDWSDLIPIITPLLEADSTAGAEGFLLQAGITETSDPDMWKQVLDEARVQARARGAELVGKRILPDGTIVDNPNAEWAITETTRDRLRQLGDDALENGWTVNETQSKLIADEGFSPARALNISRTESAFNRSRGTKIAATATGMKYKNWLLGEEACDICQANAAQGWIPIDEEFSSGDDAVPAHPSCRCANGYSETPDDGE